MDFRDVIRRRRMIRAYSDRPIAPEVVDRLLDVARRSPSAGFTQGNEFLVLTDEEDRRRFWAINGLWAAPTAQAAPLVVVPFATKDAYLDRYAEPDKGWADRDETHWPMPYWYIDCGMATENLLLAAVDEGLGTLFFGIQRDAWPALRQAFKVPERFDPIGAVTVGYPAASDTNPTSARTRRKRSTGRGCPSWVLVAGPLSSRRHFPPDTAV